MDLPSMLLDLAATPWALLVLFGAVLVDGVFPPIPSETMLIAMAGLGSVRGAPPLAAVIAVAAGAAFAGDLLAYTIGRRVSLTRLRALRSGRGVAALAWAEDSLRRRGTAFLFAARYVPIGRVAANVAAGALGYPLRRFVAVEALSATTWALYCVSLGYGAGRAFADRPLLGALVGVLGGIVVGTAIDLVLRRRFGRPVACPGERRLLHQ